MDISNIINQAAGRKLVFFFDFDGTLAEIAPTPEQAVLTPAMRECLAALSEQFVVAIISGRELSDLKQRVGLSHLLYAGNHGFEIKMPNDSQVLLQQEGDYLQAVQQFYQAIQTQLQSIEGLLIENKQHSLSVHYRLVDNSLVASIENVIDACLQDFPQLRKHHGKKVFEIRPNINWDKGKALIKIMQQLNFDTKNYMPVYIGDDVTDEDAFKAIKTCGFGILVANTSQDTAARFTIKNVAAVAELLNHFSVLQRSSL